MDHLRIHHRDEFDGVVVPNRKLSSWTEKQEKHWKEDLRVYYESIKREPKIRGIKKCRPPPERSGGGTKRIFFSSIKRDGRNFLSNCCKIEFVQCGKNARGLRFGRFRPVLHLHFSLEGKKKVGMFVVKRKRVNSLCEQELSVGPKRRRNNGRRTSAGTGSLLMSTAPVRADTKDAEETQWFDDSLVDTY